jgi:NAD(P)-dependent dehydrogenase (short-subunit alcohol dehydrogenase family)
MTSAYRELFSLKDRVAVVTGGAGILGREFCRGLAEHGARVAVLDLMGKAALELAERLRADTGAEVIGLACDVSAPDSVRAAVDQVTGEFGRIDVLLNNAASKSDLSRFFAPFEQYGLEEWRQINAVNVDGMMLMAQAVGADMVRRGVRGSIIQTSSVYGIMAPDQRIYEGSEYLGRPINSPAVYSASKAAVVGLTRYLATYWAEKGIRANCLVPGGVESGQNDEFKRRYSARVPLGRMAQAREMVGAVVYLASEASSYVTGQTLAVDGGLSAW